MITYTIFLGGGLLIITFIVYYPKTIEASTLGC